MTVGQRSSASLVLLSCLVDTLKMNSTQNQNSHNYQAKSNAFDLSQEFSETCGCNSQRNCLPVTGWQQYQPARVRGASVLSSKPSSVAGFCWMTESRTKDLLQPPSWKLRVEGDRGVDGFAAFYSFCLCMSRRFTENTL